MINIIKYNYKKESTIILACILIIIVFCILLWIKNNVIGKIELFNGRSSSGNSKRDKMKRIYKSNEVSDPDEIVTYRDDDDCDDPDGSCGSDPDS